MVGGGDDAGVECVSEAAREDEEGITRQKVQGFDTQEEDASKEEMPQVLVPEKVATKRVK
jgi:hypothetical protein